MSKKVQKLDGKSVMKNFIQQTQLEIIAIRNENEELKR